MCSLYGINEISEAFDEVGKELSQLGDKIDILGKSIAKSADLRKAKDCTGENNIYENVEKSYESLMSNYYDMLYSFSLGTHKFSGICEASEDNNVSASIGFSSPATVVDAEATEVETDDKE